MVNCMRVSKGWRDYLSKLPRLWLHLDMSNARRPVPRSFVDKAVRRSQNRLSRLTLHRFQHMDVVQNIARICKSLEDLEVLTLPMQTAGDSLIGIVQSSKCLKRVIIHSDITTNTATQIMKSGPALEVVEYRALQTYTYQAVWAGPFPNLHCLRINSPMRPSMHQLDLTNLFRLTPALHTLVLTDISQSPRDLQNLQYLPLRTLILKRIGLVSLGTLPPTLESLTVEVAVQTHVAAIHNGLHSSSLFHLTHLTLSGFTGFDRQIFSDILDFHLPDPQSEDTHNHKPTSGAPLQHLSISGTLRADARGLFRSPDNILSTSPRLLTPTLSSLNLHELPIDDDEIEALLTHPTGLQTIDLSGSRVTGASIKMLTDELKTLKEIKMDGCVRVVGRDAIAYAEKRGVVVRCKMRDTSGKGRRIRD